MKSNQDLEKAQKLGIVTENIFYSYLIATDILAEDLLWIYYKIFGFLVTLSTYALFKNNHDPFITASEI